MKTDVQLKNDVLVALMWEPNVNSSDVTVTVLNGIVTLSGSVPHFAEKSAIERAIQRVEGVKVIAEELEVNLAGIHKHTDAEIAAAVATFLKWHVWVPSHVQATVENGWVTLTGSVHWEFQRKAAQDSVSYLSGVKGVCNNIILTPSAQPTAIKDVVEKALKRDAQLDARNICVSADSGEVTLSGSIHSWGERREAATAAWNAPGVTSVDNNLVVCN